MNLPDQPVELTTSERQVYGASWSSNIHQLIGEYLLQGNLKEIGEYGWNININLYCLIIQ